MIDLMKYKYWYFAISLLVILPGLYFLARYGLKFSIDFTGGSIVEVEKRVTPKNLEVVSIQQTSSNTYIYRTKPIDTKTKDEAFKGVKVLRFETVGPSISRELIQNAIFSVALASLAILLYIAYAFRKIPTPYKSWKFGASAIIATLHDVLVLIGLFAIFGYFWNVEVDALFVTAILTTIGFSVHDTIVVFDRIRENLKNDSKKISFEGVINESLLQTLGRSLTTSLTVLFTLLALILFGGESIKWFAVALFIGVASGTLSSLFTAAPVLFIWEERGKKKAN